MGRIWRSRWVSLTGSGPTLPSVAGRPETDVRRAGIGRRPPCFTEREQDLYLGARQAESISSHHVSFRAAGPCGGEKGEEGRSQAPRVQDAQGGRSHPHRHSPPTRGVPALHTAVSDSCKRDSVGSGTGIGEPGLGMHSMGGVWGAREAEIAVLVRGQQHLVSRCRCSGRLEPAWFLFRVLEGA